MKRIRDGDTPTLEEIFERIATLEHELRVDADRRDPVDPRAVHYLRLELQASLRLLAGHIRGNARLAQRLQNVTDETVNLIDRKAGVQKEVKRLEDVLAWIFKTPQPVEEIRHVIEKEIPRRITRERQSSE